MLGLAHRDRFEPQIFADAVFGVDDQIADAERLQFRKEGVGILALLLAPHQPVAKDVLLGQQFELVIGEAGFDRQDHRRGLGDARSLRSRQAQRFLPGVGHLYRRTRFLQDRGDARAATLGIGGEQRTLARFRQRFEMVGQHGIDIVPARTFGREVAARAEAEIHHLGAFGFIERRRAVGGGGGKTRLEFARGEIERIGLQGPVIALGLSGDGGALVVIIAHILHALVHSGQRRLVDHDEVVLAEMVEQRGQLVLEQGQPVFHPRQPASVADGFVKRVLRGVGAEHLAVAAAKPLDAVIVEERLAGGQQQVRL